jgi:hypothetical protein
MAMDKESATVGAAAIKSAGSQEAAESGDGEYMGGGDSSMAGVHDSLK